MEKDQMMLLLEEIRGNVQLVAEGHALLNQKIDQVEANLSQKIEEVDKKIDRVAIDLNRKLDETYRKLDNVASNLAAHRADTEAHQGYRVAER